MNEMDGKCGRRYREQDPTACRLIVSQPEQVLRRTSGLEDHKTRSTAEVPSCRSDSQGQWPGCTAGSAAGEVCLVQRTWPYPGEQFCAPTPNRILGSETPSITWHRVQDTYRYRGSRRLVRTSYARNFGSEDVLGPDQTGAGGGIDILARSIGVPGPALPSHTMQATRYTQETQNGQRQSKI
jgi:hypothetical protein